MHTKKEIRWKKCQEKNKATLSCQEPACKLIILPLKKQKLQLLGVNEGIIATF